MTKNEITNMSSKIRNFKPNDEFNNSWITNRINQEGIDFAQKLGFLLCAYDNKGWISRDALTNSQIRNVFGEVKRIQMKVMGAEKEWDNIKSSFLLLQPKLAYATGRVVSKNKYSKLSVLSDIMTKAMQGVKADENGAVKRFMHFVDFLESILAYHKAFGGKE